jgi:hypothetical protein
MHYRAVMSTFNVCCALAITICASGCAGVAQPAAAISDHGVHRVQLSSAEDVLAELKPYIAEAGCMVTNNSWDSQTSVLCKEDSVRIIQSDDFLIFSCSHLDSSDCMALMMRFAPTQSPWGGRNFL